MSEDEAPEIPPEKFFRFSPSGELEEDLPVNAVRLLAKAHEEGWRLNPPREASFIMRLTKDDELALPFYAGWKLVINEETGKRSWRFTGAAARNCQTMTFRDAMAYLEDPTLIYPEPEGE